MVNMACFNNLKIEEQLLLVSGASWWCNS